MSCNLRILYGFYVMIQKQFFTYFSSFSRRSNISIRKNTWKNSQIIFIWSKWFKIWTNFVKEFASEGVEAAYIARTIFIFYSYLRSCVWLLLVAVTLPITSTERSFSKMNLLKKFPRNSMTSKRLGNVDLSGVSRVWQAWHMPWAPLWRGRKNCLAKLKSLFTVSLTSNLVEIISYSKN